MTGHESERDESAERLEARVAALETAIGALQRRCDLLGATESIRACIYRFCRGLDRLDRSLMASAFHADATVDFGAIYRGAVAGFLDATMEFQKGQSEIQHLVGNVLVEVRADQAVVESYELARHASRGDGSSLVLACRNLDRFERRDGEWRIAARQKVIDWGRQLAPDAWLAGAPLQRGTRDGSDPSFAVMAFADKPA